ncbi:unnamed protein product [Cuscuta epithymum]|uniref:Uncharacterized protein n=1 Tax=Cuscuta epithymum TaxID=186058 RepID=A0AAV0EAA1_9ASTE|nr:unnamed protein product [Cuscuta epithymum]
MGGKRPSEKKWVLSNSPDQKKKAEQDIENGGEEEEEEALSLSDLPNENHETQFHKYSPPPGDGAREEEFDFCSIAGSMKDSEMCVADELFFQGQILPLPRRHSVSADSAPAILRCNSFERCRSAGCTTSASSRSSSTRSHQSSSSAASSAGAAAHGKPPVRAWNRFQFSQPSPTPHIRISKAASSHAHATPSSKHSRGSGALWTLFRVGLVTLPETGSQSFSRVRSRDKNKNSYKFVRSESGRSSVDDSRSNVIKKLKRIFVDRNLGFFDSCKCSGNSVETTPLTSENNVREMIKKKKKDGVGAGRNSMSRNRTFEWLKQLSLDGEVLTNPRLDQTLNQ